jgi:hypothetical protein
MVVLMTFADSVLGLATWTACEPGTWSVTVSQSSNFLRGVRVGVYVELTPVILRATTDDDLRPGDFLVKGERCSRRARSGSDRNDGQPRPAYPQCCGIAAASAILRRP